MFRSGKYVLVCLGHLICVAVLLKAFSFISPSFLQCVVSCFFNFVAYLCIARYTFLFTKRRFLKESIIPDKKAVLITGCDTGFGHALAKRLDSKGYHVFATCLFPSGKGAEELRTCCSERLKILELNITRDDSVTAAFEFVKENLGHLKLWAIVNNAGIQKGFTVDLASLQDFKDTMEVNGFGMVRVTKAFLPLLKQSKGRVVNLTSLHGSLAFPHNAPYVMSKFAASGFNECLRLEMDAWGVGVIEVKPEFFATRLTDVQEVWRRLDSEMASIAPDLKVEYGGKYFEKLKTWMEYTIKKYSSSKIHKVIDALESAVSAKHPEIAYRPSRNCFLKICIAFFEILPLTAKDFIVKIGLICSSFPKPAAAQKGFLIKIK